MVQNTNEKRTLSVDNILVFPDGAGGNFLTSICGGITDNVYAGINEYKAKAAWNEIDNYQIFNSNLVVKSNLDTAVENFIKLYMPKKQDQRIKYLLGHFPPKYMSRAFELKVKNAFWLQPHSKFSEITNIIHASKKLGFRDYNKNPYMIADILNGIVAPSRLEVDSTEYNASYNVLSAELSLVAPNSLIVWKFAIHCKVKNVAINRDAAKSFISTFIFGENFATSNYTNVYTSERYHTEWDRIKSQCAYADAKTYDQVFFDLDLFALDGLNLNDSNIYHKVAEYSERTILSLLQILNVTQHEYLRDFIQDATSRLSVSKLNI
jgi:hypothetical protein